MPVDYPNRIYANVKTDVHNRNCLRMEAIDPSYRCQLKPSNEQAKQILEKRPFHVSEFWHLFGYCASSVRCNDCDVVKNCDHDFVLENNLSDHQYVCLICGKRKYM